MSDSQVSRRQFVGGAAALGGGIALPMAGVGMARPQQALDLSVPQDFLTAIETGEAVWPTFKEGLDVNRVIAAAHASHAARGWTRVKDF